MYIHKRPTKAVGSKSSTSNQQKQCRRSRNKSSGSYKNNGHGLLLVLADGHNNNNIIIISISTTIPPTSHVLSFRQSVVWQTLSSSSSSLLRWGIYFGDFSEINIGIFVVIVVTEHSRPCHTVTSHVRVYSWGQRQPASTAAEGEERIRVGPRASEKRLLSIICNVFQFYFGKYFETDTHPHPPNG